MRTTSLILFLLMYGSAFAQVSDNFSDGNFTQNPSWQGKTENFIVNENKQLQLTISVADTSYLSTSSEAIKNAQWQASIKINYNPSSANYACFYLVAKSAQLPITRGYFVQIGNTADEISLYRQDSLSKVKIIDGVDGRVNANPVDVCIKVTCDSLSEWKLYSKLQHETTFNLEGSVIDSTYKESNYTGVLCKNSASVGKAYFFDSIQVEGYKYEKQKEPIIIPIVYEKPQVGDVLINEVLFNSAENAEEFIEIYNHTDRTIDVSGLKITTKKKDGSLNAGAAIPNGTQMLPQSYLALCKNPSVDSLYYNCPITSNFVAVKSWMALNNEGATILICNAAKDTIYDELSYSSKWHHPFIKNNQGVSLERINPNLPTQNPSSWHSASSEVNYGTPGYKNSQYMEISAIETPKEFWLQQENFTPNNDGDNDALLINYRMAENGWMSNITIFDASGQKIKGLYKSYLLSTEGILLWDGITDNNTCANIGLYIIYVELFNANKGETKRHKLVCAVSGK